ncbi:DNA/RNA helicase domain-containing protein [Reichenbachiella sp.]|uniref:DNA/RNA helicase domain-containing protein n=1 Tax=Reichenbachiella sp. TaxID=2184521 RepID=UPI003296B0A5
MKEINLISTLQAFKELDPSLCEKYFDLYGIKPDTDELDDLASFAEQLKMNCDQIDVFDSYFLNYSIPQIGKEFDLLRFGKDHIVNIELKSENTGEKITKQLIQNQYYLSFLGKPVHSYTYVSDEKQLYSMDGEQNLVLKDFKSLVESLINQNLDSVSNIDDLFNPSNYLVSPFNSTKEFMEGGYFLTNQQEDFKKGILKAIEKSTNFFFSICGKAGTGKTLLTFDIAKEVMNAGSKVLVIHCGNLNEGHSRLCDEYEWNICSIRNWYNSSFDEYSLVIIDEVQRVRPSQLSTIIDEIKSNRGYCIFSYDKGQCLRNGEILNNIEQKILDETSSKRFELTEKIRTNKEIASFIKALFNKAKRFEKISRSNIEVHYFLQVDDAKKFMELQGRQGWKIINYTPDKNRTLPYENSIIPSNDNAHGVIGQEYDKVIAVIDPYFCYAENDRLAICGYGYSKKPYYHPVLMLLQIMTRTRRKLSIIVINNPEIMKRCLSILK